MNNLGFYAFLGRAHVSATEIRTTPGNASLEIDATVHLSSLNALLPTKVDIPQQVQLEQHRLEPAEKLLS